MAVPFTPDSYDTSILLLWSVFGQVISEITRGMGVVSSLSDWSQTALVLEMIPAMPGSPSLPAWSQTPFNIGGGTGIVSALNSGVLFFGALLLAWTTIFGVVNTANDGEALGKRWSTLMTPLRTLTAASMLIPTSYGFSGIQVFVLIAAIMSCGLASYGWKMYSATSLAQDVGNIYQTAITRDGGTKNMVVDLYRMGMCAKAYNTALAQVTPTYTPNMQLIIQSDTTGYSLSQDKATITFGIETKDTGQSNSTRSICGAVQITGDISTPVNTGVGTGVSAPNPYSATVQPTGSDMLKSDLRNIMNPISAVAASQGDTAQVVKFSILSGFVCGAAGTSVCNPTPVNGTLPPDFNAGFVIGKDLDTLITSSVSAINGSTTVVNSADFRKVVDDLNEALRLRLEAVVANMASQNYTYVDSAGVSSTKQSNVIYNLTRGGWIFAGSYYNQLATIKNILREKTKVSSTFRTVEPTWDIGGVLTDKDLLSAAQGVMAQYRSMADTVAAKAFQAVGGDGNVRAMLENRKGVATEIGGASYSVTCGFGGFKTSYSPAELEASADIKSDFLQVTEGFGKKTVAYFTGQLGKSGIDPIMQIKHAGDCMVTAAEFMIVGGHLLDGFLDWMVATTKAAHEATNATIAGSLGAGFASAAIYSLVYAALATVSQVLEMLWPGIHGLLYLGYFLGYWIPMIPYVVFALGVIGWLAGVLEAVLAAPLWAAMHMTPGGDSFIGSQSQGYMLLLGVFFRPILMVVGLIASLTMLYPATWFVNKSFALAMSGLQDSAGTLTGIYSIVVFLLIYCVIIFQVIMFCFTLPQQVPNKILTWIGSGVSDFGESGAVSKIEGGAQHAGQSVKGSMREYSAKQDAAKAQRAQSAAAARVEQRHQEQLQATRGVSGGKSYGDGQKASSPSGHMAPQARSQPDASPRMEALASNKGTSEGASQKGGWLASAKAGARAAVPNAYGAAAVAARGTRLAGAVAGYHGKAALNSLGKAFNNVTGKQNPTGKTG